MFHREAAVAGQLRKQTHALLARAASSSSNSVPTSTAITPSPRRCAFFDRKPDGSLEILRPTESVTPPVGKSAKAFATLDRGPNYPYINAMSGFTQTGWPNVLKTENGQRRQIVYAHSLVYQETKHSRHMSSHNYLRIFWIAIRSPRGTLTWITIFPISKVPCLATPSILSLP